MQAEITYNWDDIEVGRFDLNHSENFFTEKHSKHEKFSQEFNLIRKMEGVNINESFSNEIAIEVSENKENAKPVAIQQDISKIDTHLAEEKSQVKIESELQDPVKLEVQQTDVKISPSSILVSNGNRRPANLLTRAKTPQPEAKSKAGRQAVSGKNVKIHTKTETPHAYDFKDIYQKKKEEKIKKLLEEEKKNRVFHCRPAPKSVATSSDSMPTHSKHNFTTPVTPLVLKHSKEANDKRLQRIAEWKKRNPPVKFASREAAVLQEEPFKPKKSGQTVQMQPFNLNVERRIEERKQYDVQNRRAAEEKKKQEEEERKKREEEMVKEIRKLATFKARPNPFK